MKSHLIETADECAFWNAATLLGWSSRRIASFMADPTVESDTVYGTAADFGASLAMAA
jgi:hypothetical protein